MGDVTFLLEQIFQSKQSRQVLLRMQSCQQQIVALDTKFIKHMVPNQPAFRKVYLKRRLQLLGEERGLKEGETLCSCCVRSSLPSEEVRTSTNYLKVRAQLLR